MLILVVDDLTFSSNNQQTIDRFKVNLTEAFNVKILGPLEVFVGFEITRTPAGIYVNHPSYVKRMIELHNLQHISSAPTPLPERADISSRGSDEKQLSTYDDMIITDIGLWLDPLRISQSVPDLIYLLQYLCFLVSFMILANVT